MNIVNEIHARAKAAQKTIVLPEATDERTLRATAACAKAGLAKIVLLGEAAKVEAAAKEAGVDISAAAIREPATDEYYDEFVETLTELRRAKGMTKEKAAETMKDVMYFAAMMVKCGKADGYVSGAVHSTGDTVRPALQIIKTAPGIKTVSSTFVMLLPASSPYAATNDLLFFSDCAMVPEPDSEQLADICLSTVETAKSLIPDITPNVAFLSFSTMGSAKHPLVDKAQTACQVAKERAPELNIDGEMQADAALIERVGASKAPGSKVAGKANILIFPDLQAGNIGYKLVERLAGASALGPVLQGLAKPVNDLSRGCKWEDIVDVVALTACQAAQ